MLEDLIKERLRKLSLIKKSGANPYPVKVKRDVSIGKVVADFSKLSKSKKNLSLTGRVMSFRNQGGLIFCDLEDSSGRIQIVFRKGITGNFNFLKGVIDRGDFLSVTGVLFLTKKREKSLEAKSAQIISKSLRPLPIEWFGLEDKEEKLRRRYLDFVLNKESREIFKRKAIFWSTIREILIKEGFLEVETPVFESVPGGADAEPFKTHYNALDTDFFLRISLELPLKKLLIGGFEKVFEIGRIFRNEGIDREHLQDYTQLEFYWAYRDYNDCMKFIEKLYKATIKKTIGALTTTFQGKKINWGKRWPRVDFTREFIKANNLDPILATREELFKKAETLDLNPQKGLGKGRLIDLIYKKTVRPNLIQPCFLVDLPVEAVPLAKRSTDNPNVVECFHPIACGTELGTGYSELNDPIDQRARFEEQMKLRKAGDKEAQRLDEEFVEALEYGMPPAAGFGVSERLFSILMDKPVRETVVFPQVRPKK